MLNNETKSTPVVFKVLYPGLKESVKSDIALLKKAMWAFCKMTGRDMNLDPLFSEIKSVLQNEMDYDHEKLAYQKFNDLTSKRKWPFMEVKTPQIISDFCTDQFLCMTYEPGTSLKSWLETNPSEKKREKLALTLLDLYMTEFFDWGFVQTDPNPGNFIIQNNTLVALDFGATKYYDIKFREKYVKLLKAIKSLDEKLIVKEAIAFGLISKKESPEAFSVFTQLLKLGVQPFFNDSVFDFSDDQFLKENSRLSKELLKQLKYSPPPHQILFLHRKLGGIYAILRKMNVAIDVNQFWNRIDQVIFND
jgi:aarF domain-containing kinase